MKVKDVIEHLENIAPLAYQEDYDNAGLSVGGLDYDVKGILLSLDITELVLDEAIKNDCNLIISHHPILFKPIKKINGNNSIENILIKAIKNDIAIYSTHTNLDNILYGVSYQLAKKLALKNIKILSRKPGTLGKLVTFIPQDSISKVTEALYSAGAGNIGNYDCCSFQIDGIGSFRPNNQANPSIGSRGVLEFVNEKRVEVIFPKYKESSILQALKQNHPYEEIAYYFTDLLNTNQDCGAGIIGELESVMNANDFLSYLKVKLNLKVFKHSSLLKKPISKIALCGGAGSFLINEVKKEKADVYITSDIKYHSFFEAEDKILIIDIGHYESEIYSLDFLNTLLTSKFPDHSIRKTEIITNPVCYYFI